MDALFSALKEFDFEKMLPELGAYVGGLKFWAWVLVMVGPVLLLVLGIRYSKNPPSDVNCSWAYANKRIKSDRALWEKAHREAGKTWIALGAVLTAAGLICGILFLIVNALAAATIALWVVVIELVLILGSKFVINGKIK